MKIEIKKFGTILNSRPAGKDAALSIKAYNQPGPNENIELDFSGVISVGPSWLDEVLSSLQNEYGKDRVTCLPSDNASVNASLQTISK